MSVGQATEGRHLAQWGRSQTEATRSLTEATECSIRCCLRSHLFSTLEACAVVVVSTASRQDGDACCLGKHRLGPGGLSGCSVCRPLTRLGCQDSAVCTCTQMPNPLRFTVHSRCIPYWPYAFPQLIRFGVRIVLFFIPNRTSKPQIIALDLRLSVARIANNSSTLRADEGCG